MDKFASRVSKRTDLNSTPKISPSADKWETLPIWNWWSVKAERIADLVKSDEVNVWVLVSGKKRILIEVDLGHPVSGFDRYDVGNFVISLMEGNMIPMVSNDKSET